MTGDDQKIQSALDIVDELTRRPPVFGIGAILVNPDELADLRTCLLGRADEPHEPDECPQRVDVTTVTDQTRQFLHGDCFYMRTRSHTQ